MKKLSLVLILFIVVTMVNAQNPLRKGKKQLNVGIGFSDWGVPIYGGIDFGIHPDISLGLEGSYRVFSDDWNYHLYKHSILGFSGNGNYHFNRLLNIYSLWDFYAGLNLGFYVWSSPSGYKGSHASGLGLGAQIGGRYYITPDIGLNLEFGSVNAFSGGKAGLTFKF